MTGFGILSGVTFLPLVGVIILMFHRGDDAATVRSIRHVALWTTLATFLVTLLAWSRFDPAIAGFQMLESQAWAGGGLVYKMGVDGMSFPFVVLPSPSSC